MQDFKERYHRRHKERREYVAKNGIHVAEILSVVMMPTCINPQKRRGNEQAETNAIERSYECGRWQVRCPIPMFLANFCRNDFDPTDEYPPSMIESFGSDWHLMREAYTTETTTRHVV